MVHALDAETGEPRWIFTTRGRIDSSPAIVGDRIYVGSNDGRLYGLNLANGTPEWEYEVGSAVSASPAIASGRIVVGAQDGLVYCFG